MVSTSTRNGPLESRGLINRRRKVQVFALGWSNHQNLRPLAERHYFSVSKSTEDRGFESCHPCQSFQVYVVLRFESEEAALAWYADPAYQPLKKIRLDSSDHGNLVLAKQFVLPGA